jgi:PAS domain S-box-containing protein
MSKILVVDDSALDRFIIKSMLSEYQILTACDGLDAMEQINKDEDIDLLILDLNMPNMNGFQVLTALKSDARYNRLRTIILTNYDELDNEIKGLQLGAVDFIRKPIHMNSLKTRVDIHIELIHIQRLLQQKLDEQSLTLDTIFYHAPVGIAISYGSEPLMKDSNFVIMNPMYEEITGRSKEELLKLGWAKITHPDDFDQEMKNFRKLQSGEINNYSIEKRFIKPDGSMVWVHMIVAPMTLSNKHAYNYICIDISDRKEIENNLRYNNEYDRWTGLYNRSYLESLLKNDAILRTAQKRAIVGINLNAMHLLTTTYRFHYTQDLIKEIAQSLALHCIDQRLLFNTYENRFVFYWKNYPGKKELYEFCEAVANTLESILTAERIGGGIGVVEIDQSNEGDIDQLLKKLLIASERAVDIYDRDFGICFYEAEIEAQISREEDIQCELTQITETENDGGLFLQYQPILDLQSNQICGFEALSRLKSSKHGLIPPLEFIPIAEKTMPIIPIGEKIILQAFRFLNKLKELGYGTINVSINISAIQLLSNGFCKNLFKMINEMRVNPENIGLEITESVLASNFQEINTILGELKDAGLYIAIDDFGTGYSSLARERELNINCLKIDKYFIDKLLLVDPDKAITSDIVSMAHKLGHCAIAEGVEHEKQRHYLLNCGCDKIQGYLISKPLGEEAAIELLNKQIIINNDCH